ncbi:MAG: hypothetical protein P8O76_07180 [Methylophilaceae bacterium]|nr:hypothetical protein [Methylophilaceae bacterium]MDG1445828.1 hypothetical protein [Methylophilaceae bacterium]MDG1820299.1 hypothetical protein [Methylophilaceae bacterium]MDG2293096.1 hypothetical protein [Methylophilaceae bacterium]
MLQRFLIHLSFILLFALTQMGVATHEISHLTDVNPPHQQDKSKHESQCEQCLSYSHAATANVTPTFTFSIAATEHLFSAPVFTRSLSVHPVFYSARAPPNTSPT